RGLGAARFCAARGGDARPGRGLRIVEHALGGEHRRLGELALYPEIDRAMLQRLEAADRFAELLARAQIVERHLEHALAEPGELRARGDERRIERALERYAAPPGRG